MASKAFKSVDDYVATFPEDTQAVLRQLRAAIGRALPGAEEVISYNMPAYRLGDRPVVWFAGWKKFYSIYPLTGRLFESLKKELEPYKADRSTLRFPLSLPVSVKLIERIAKLRAKEGRRRAARFQGEEGLTDGHDHFPVMQFHNAAAAPGNRRSAKGVESAA